MLTNRMRADAEAAIANADHMLAVFGSNMDNVDDRMCIVVAEVNGLVVERYHSKGATHYNVSLVKNGGGYITALTLRTDGKAVAVDEYHPGAWESLLADLRNQALDSLDAAEIDRLAAEADKFKPVDEAVLVEALRASKPTT